MPLIFKVRHLFLYVWGTQPLTSPYNTSCPAPHPAESSASVTSPQRCHRFHLLVVIFISNKNTSWGCHLWKKANAFPVSAQHQPIFTHQLIDVENAERGMVIRRGQVMWLFLCLRCEVGDLMSRGEVVGEICRLCCMVCLLQLSW